MMKNDYVRHLTDPEDIQRKAKVYRALMLWVRFTRRRCTRWGSLVLVMLSVPSGMSCKSALESDAVLAKTQESTALQIRELKSEVEKLRSMLKDMGSPAGAVEASAPVGDSQYKKMREQALSDARPIEARSNGISLKNAETQQLIMVDDRNRRRGMFRVDEDGSIVLSFFDPNDHERIAIGVRVDGTPFLITFSEHGEVNQLGK